tara:strand:+ start:5595 stop:6671 length:1077 start_codon:yes stop_codon:yes gene_type:complete
MDKRSLINEKKKPKVRKEKNIPSILDLSNYELIHTEKYKVCQLKEMCTFYKLKKSGNKNELTKRIYEHLKYSVYAIKIQKNVRHFLVKKYIQYGGPAILKRNKCINDTDFISLEDVKNIPINQFFSFSDKDNNIYGCNIISFFGLLMQQEGMKSIIQNSRLDKLFYSILFNIKNENITLPLNPYNRSTLDIKIITNFLRYLKLASVNNISYIIVEEEEIIEPNKKLELKILDQFQYINQLGNYADGKWLLSLQKNMLILFIRELYDIWTYRAQLSTSTMREIVTPHGNPFLGLNLHLSQNQTQYSLLVNITKIIERLIRSSSNVESRSLGAYYVLAALTLVNEDARNTLPWLFQSVAH